MMARFVLDEVSWRLGPSDASLMTPALDALLERIEVAVERQEIVIRHTDFCETQLGDGPALFSVLYESDCAFVLERDLVERLRLALDQMQTFDEGQLRFLDASVAGAVHLAPGVCWAHEHIQNGRAVAVLPLPSVNGFSGVLSVSVQDVFQELHFVTTEQQHRAFFRDAIEVENMNHDGLASIAASAFPELDWVEGVWQDLRRHKHCFFDEHRKTTALHLSVLNDATARLFHSHPGGSGVDSELAALGVEAAPENGRARGHKPSIDDRTRSYNGQNYVFWWHTKIRWDEGRIHFLHYPKRPGSARPEHGHIVVGIFKDHCVLPG